MHPFLNTHREQISALCRSYGVRRLEVFGSASDSERFDTARSDVDLLVEFEPGNEPGLLGLASMEAELAAMLGVNKVDLRTPQDLSRHFRDQVLRTAEVQYAR